MADGHTFQTEVRTLPLPPGTYGVSFGAHQRGDGRWVVTQDAHCIDRCGDKDTITDVLSEHASQAEALSALASIQREAA